MNTSSHASTTHKVFYHEARALTITTALIVSILIVVGWSSFGVKAGSIIMSIFFLSFVWRVLYPVIYSQVSITDVGLDFRQVGYRICTPWSNIERMTYAQFGRTAGDILVLREPQVRVQKRLIQLRRSEVRFLEQNAEFAPLGKVMPLFLLNPTWRTGKLGQEIRRYAPHLFEEYEK